MPRGVAAKREELSMKYTSIHIPLVVNANLKNVSSNYLKTDTNTIWGRKGKEKVEEGQEAVAPGKKGSNVIVIHPGSRFLRVGRAIESTPLTVSNVIARKHSTSLPPATFTSRLHRSPSDKENTGPATRTPGDDEYAVAPATDDPIDAKITSISTSLRDRMRFYKLNVTKEATDNAIAFNSTVKPELIPEENDPFRIQWVTSTPSGEYVVGERVFRIVEPHNMGYAVRWPLYGNRLNTRQYKSVPELMGDIEAIWSTVLRDGLKIERKQYKDYSVILVVPDFYERTYMREMCNLILVTMGFKQLCVQQESICATFGSGISNACVIDIGAVKTSIACVDEGMVIPDSRMTLSIAGDDITEFLYSLLQRISFPYSELDLARSYHWQVLEDLKSRLCTLNESDVAENVYDFSVRTPKQATEKYNIRAYDEIILAPMCVFEPGVIDFDSKQQNYRPVSQPVIEDVVENTGDYATEAMVISTQHLLLVKDGQPPPTVAPAIVDVPMPTESEETKPDVSVKESNEGAVSEAVDSKAVVSDGDIEMQDAESPTRQESNQSDPGPEQPPPAQAQQSTIADAPAPSLAASMVQSPETVHPPNYDPTFSYPGGYPLDLEFEASKLPLDVAVFNSTRACGGGDEKIRKYLQAVLVVGGTSLIPGMAHALESRLQAIATPLVKNMEKVQIIPPPKDVDPRSLVWKGACVLAKMESINDMWVTPSDWDKFELRAIRERCFFL